MIEKYDLSGGFVTIKDEPTYKWVEMETLEKLRQNKKGVEGMSLFEVRIAGDNEGCLYVVASDISKIKEIVNKRYRFSSIELIRLLKGEVIIEGV